MAHVARVTVVNPSGRRKQQERKAMAKKKRRRARARKVAGNPKKTRTRKKRRAHANPSRKTPKRVHARRRRSNPRRRHVMRRTSARRKHHTPSRRRHHGRRRHRRNPGIPVFAQAGIAAGLAVLVFAGASAGAFALTQRLDPSLATLSRNRTIASGAAVLGGLALAAKKFPLYGAGVAAGGLVLLLGSQIGIKLSALLQPASTTKVGQVYGQMGAYEPVMGQVYGQMGAYEPVMGQVYGQMGDLVAPAPPWQSSNPF